MNGLFTTLLLSAGSRAGVAYFGSINGTTVATAVVTWDVSMHPSLSFDRATHPLVDVHGSVAWITVPSAAKADLFASARVAFVGVRSANMSGGGTILSLPISSSGNLSPTPLSRTPYAAVHIAYAAGTTAHSTSWLLACDYGDGFCSTFAVDRDGKVASVSSSACEFTVPPPAPVNPSPRQTSSHPHEANFAPRRPSSRGGVAVGGAEAPAPLAAFVPDLGGDRVHYLSIDRASGAITLDVAKSLVLARGTVRCFYVPLLPLHANPSHHLTCSTVHTSLNRYTGPAAHGVVTDSRLGVRCLRDHFCRCRLPLRCIARRVHVDDASASGLDSRSDAQVRFFFFYFPLTCSANPANSLTCPPRIV